MDREQLSRFVEKYRLMVFRLAYSYVGAREDAEDIAQEVFLKLCKNGAGFKDEEHEKAWLIRVTINASKNAVKSLWRRNRADMPDNLSYYFGYGQNELYDCVMRLKSKYRAAVYLYYYEDYPVKDVARILRISESAVTTRLARARKELKKTYFNNFNTDTEEGVVL